MKCECRNPEVVKRYINAYDSAKDKVESGEIELGYNEGEFLEPCSDGRGNPLTHRYVTGSGKGKYYVDEGCSTALVLVFEGRRNSFIRGSGFLGFQPMRVDGWAVTETSQKYRGAFEGRVNYLRRACSERFVYEVDSIELREMDVDYYREKIVDGIIADTVVKVSEYDDIVAVCYDVRDLNERELHDIRENSVEQ